MAKVRRKDIHRLSERLHVSEDLLVHCVEFALVEVEGHGKSIDLSAGTALRLRRLQRLSELLDIDVSVAALFLDQMEKITRLEREIKLLQRRSAL